MNQAIIKIAEADAYLILFPLWTALADPEKQDHIAKASVYIQTRWECAKIDWADDTTISDVIREACAYYAYADLSGNLYGDIGGTVDVKGSLKSYKDKLDVLSEEKSFYEGGSSSGYGSVLGYPDALMGTMCTFNTACGQTLVRD